MRNAATSRLYLKANTDTRLSCTISEGLLPLENGISATNMVESRHHFNCYRLSRTGWFTIVSKPQAAALYSLMPQFVTHLTLANGLRWICGTRFQIHWQCCSSLIDVCFHFQTVAPAGILLTKGMNHWSVSLLYLRKSHVNRIEVAMLVHCVVDLCHRRVMLLGQGWAINLALGPLWEGRV